MMGELRGGSTIGGYPIETTKGSQSKVDAHAGDTTKHITATERTTWNAKAGTAVATTSANGLMAAADKTKLDGIATGANNYTLPAATASVLGGVKTGTNITNSSGTISVPNASTSVKGAVQLYNALTSTSTELALTAAQGKALNDKIVAIEAEEIQIGKGSDTKRYIKIAEMPSPTTVATHDNSLVFIATAVGNFGTNTPGSLIAHLSNRGSIGGQVYVLNDNGTNACPIQYVNNTTTGKVDIYYVDSSSSYEHATSIKVLSNTGGNTFKLFSTVTTAPTGLTAYTSFNKLETQAGAQTKVSTHANNSTAHITAAERTAWNAKAGTSLATTASNGLMAAADKIKLDGIAAGANNYTLPTATASVLGGVKTGTNITNTSGLISVADGTTSAKGVVQLSSATNSTSTALAATASAVKAAYDLAASKAGTAAVTSSANGLMIASDKAKLDQVAKQASKIADTRTVNNPPTHYWTNFSNQVVHEFKSITTLGLTSAQTGSVNYVILETLVGWSDSSGGKILQYARGDNGLVFRRVSTSDSTWGAWEREISLAELGTLSNLKTSAKGTVVDSLNELFQSASDGKKTVANAITGKGVTTSTTATYQQMANNIAAIQTDFPGLYYDPEYTTSSIPGNVVLYTSDDVRTTPVVQTDTTSRVHYGNYYTPDGRYFIQQVGYTSNSLSVYTFDASTKKYTKLHDIPRIIRHFDVGTTAVLPDDSFITIIFDRYPMKIVQYDEDHVLVHHCHSYARCVTLVNFKTGTVVLRMDPAAHSNLSSYFYHGIMGVCKIGNVVGILSVYNNYVYLSSFKITNGTASYKGSSSIVSYSSAGTYTGINWKVAFDDKENVFVLTYTYENSSGANYTQQYTFPMYVNNVDTMTYSAYASLFVNTGLKTDESFEDAHYKLIDVRGKGFGTGVKTLKVIVGTSGNIDVWAFSEYKVLPTRKITVPVVGFVDESSIDCAVTDYGLLITFGKRSGYGIGTVIIDKEFTSYKIGHLNPTGGYGTCGAIHPSLNFIACATKSGGTATVYLNGNKLNGFANKNKVVFVDDGKSTLVKS